ncbi:hypothetical protein FDECE_14051 [Fusarium decemcellulare]|nr:hypothetical protein FDECE_14051 [Fusarium decemcellulare]
MEGPNPKGNMSDFDKVCEGRSGRTGLQEAPEDVARESKLWADPQRRLDAFQRPEAYRLEPCYLVPRLGNLSKGPRTPTVPFPRLVGPRGTVLEASQHGRNLRSHGSMANGSPRNAS